MKKIYIAGPLFTPPERSLLEEIDNLCRTAGFVTYLPHRDAGLFNREETPSRFFFEKDLERLDESELIIAVLNGAEIDPGTAWEMGYAFARGKKIIGFLDDSRIYEPYQQMNPMLINSLAALTESLDELRQILELED
jgi:nucleoside 2-deoxyribosyltransferase